MDEARRPLPILPQRRVHVINVVSRKGGAGKTTMALLAARYLAEHPVAPRVTVLDLDFSGTSLREALGILKERGANLRETDFVAFLRDDGVGPGWEALAADVLERYPPREEGPLPVEPPAWEFYYAASADEGSNDGRAERRERASETLTLAGKAARDLVRARLHRLIRWVLASDREHEDFIFVLDNSPGIRGLSKELIEDAFEPRRKDVTLPPPEIHWNNVLVTTPDRQDLLASFAEWIEEWERRQDALVRRGRSKLEATAEAARSLLFLVNKRIAVDDKGSRVDSDVGPMLETIIPVVFGGRGFDAGEVRRLVASGELQVASCEQKDELAVMFRGVQQVAIPEVGAHVPGLRAFLDRLMTPPEPAKAPAAAKRTAKKRARKLDEYYVCGGEEIELTQVEDGIAVGLAPALVRAKLERQGLCSTMQLDQPNVEVFQLPRGVDAQGLVERLRAEGDVRFANRVYRFDPEDPDDVLVLTDQLAVRFDPPRGRSDEELAERFGLHLLEPVAGMPHGYLAVVKAGCTDSALVIANRLLDEKVAVFAEPDWVQAFVRRGRRPPKWQEADQWHHDNTGQSGGTHLADTGVFRAWKLGATGKGTTIAVIDDAIDIDHHQLDRRGKLVQGFNVANGSSDPRPHPTSSEEHGTSVAGVALAARTRGKYRAPSGVAPDARLVPIRFPLIAGHHRVHLAFKHALDHGADVVNCSWGPRGNIRLPGLVAHAIDELVKKGRGGLGTPVFFAAGNSKKLVSLNRWASYKHAITVAASDHHDRRAHYSNFGPGIWVCAPSAPPAGVITLGIGGGHVDDFAGTSAACPEVAGVAALMLSVNPKLSWTEAKDILARTADKIDPGGSTFEDWGGQKQSTAYDATGHSIAYGYGRVNAERAVAMALDYKNGKKP